MFNWFEVMLMILGGIGMTLIIVDGSVFAPIRNRLSDLTTEVNENKRTGLIQRNLWPKLHKLVNCYQCSGFWAGVISMLLIMIPHCGSCCFSLAFWHLANVFLAGCSISFLAMLGMAAINYFDSR